MKLAEHLLFILNRASNDVTKHVNALSGSLCFVDQAIVYRGGRGTHLARGARVSWLRIQESLQSQASLLCSNLRLWRRGRSEMTSSARLVRLLVCSVSDTSWGSSENISEVRKYFNKEGRKYFAHHSMPVFVMKVRMPMLEMINNMKNSQLDPHSPWQLYLLDY